MKHARITRLSNILFHHFREKRYDWSIVMIQASEGGEELSVTVTIVHCAL